MHPFSKSPYILGRPYYSTFFISNLNNTILKAPTPPNPPYISKSPYILGQSYFSTFFIAKHIPAILRDPTTPKPPYIFQVTLHFGSSLLFDILYC